MDKDNIKMTEEQKKSFKYMSSSEAVMPPKWFDAQIALGLKSCKTIGEVCELLEDVRKHERIIAENMADEAYDEIEESAHKSEFLNVLLCKLRGDVGDRKEKV
jgi:hypothetical protein